MAETATNSQKKTCFSCHNKIEESKLDSRFIQEHYGREIDDLVICKKCANKERINSLSEKYLPLINELSSDISVNHVNLQILINGIVNAFRREHRYNQNEILITLKNVIENLGKEYDDPKHMDARNAWGLRWCNKVSKVEV